MFSHVTVGALDLVVRRAWPARRFRASVQTGRGELSVAGWRWTLDGVESFLKLAVPAMVETARVAP